MDNLNQLTGVRGWSDCVAFLLLVRIYKTVVPEPFKQFLRKFWAKTGLLYKIEASYNREPLLIWFKRLSLLYKRGKLTGLPSAQENILSLSPAKENICKLLNFYFDERNERFDFNGILFNIKKDAPAWVLFSVIADTFTIPLFFNDDHNKKNIKLIELYMPEGPYGYTDGSFDVTVHKGDIVLDAGAWFGDFSVYAVSKGAVCYAFEPITASFKLLEKNALTSGKNLIPIKSGLGAKKHKTVFSICKDDSVVNKAVPEEHEKNYDVARETVDIITVDDFVKDNNISRVDFIKADIEGCERDMLRGAVETLKKFAPKLALCTYHLIDDPEVLSAMILKANPAYKIVQKRKKLYACV